MSDISKTFNINYESGSKTDVPNLGIPRSAIEPAIVVTGTTATANTAAPSLVRAGAEPGTNSTVSQVASGSNIMPDSYDVEKPRRIVTRGKIEHEPKS